MNEKSSDRNCAGIFCAPRRFNDLAWINDDVSMATARDRLRWWLNCFRRMNDRFYCYGWRLIASTSRFHHRSGTLGVYASFGLLSLVTNEIYIRDDVYKRWCGSCAPSFTTTARLYYDVTTCRSFLMRLAWYTPPATREISTRAWPFRHARRKTGQVRVRVLAARVVSVYKMQ